MTLKQHVTKNIVHKLLSGLDYRIEIVNLIDAEFLQYCLEFLKDVADAKRTRQNGDKDWYKHAFLSDDLQSDEVIINSGLNRKTIMNMYNSAARNIVREVTNEHFDSLNQGISNSTGPDTEINIQLKVSSKDGEVDLNTNESLIVMNTLAVKRAQLRGGLWSTAGKQAEKPLMLTFCELFSIDKKYYRVKTIGGQNTTDYDREIDFYFVDKNGTEQKVEVKLMGQGNPESADAVIARHSKIFAGDSLSYSNKRQLNSLGVQWIELRSKDRFKQFTSAMHALGIPYNDVNPNDQQIRLAIDRVFQKSMD